MTAPAEAEPVPGQPRSERGKRRRGERILTPLEQIRVTPQGVSGPWAYYLRADGATIRDALVLYPNGGALPRDEDPKGRYSTNADYFRARQARKGLEYLGSTLTPEAVRKLVATLARNRDDEVLFLEDEIADCQHVIDTSDDPKNRDYYRMRRDAYQRRLDMINQPLDVDGLIGELDEIARAQRLAKFDPRLLDVMREMVGEMNTKFESAMKYFSAGKASEADPELTGIPKGRRSKGTSVPEAEFTDGKDFLDAD